ncbi:spore coat protein SA [Paenibacillus phyllosphaerae]|uniref:Spore coat protein SA n=1 Tax=Paenibacillus phyllosphaerae TaxID=274593 RepID=A0A7W5B2Q3_9BACL|nr:glycosyltransferase family 4 protein [Paenibacillus phyllosphaerae]MBB3112801.1 spore coat protein SA [Paenibacillus phyllosphaerae]
MKILAIAPDRLPLPPIKGGSVETVMYQFFSRLARTERVTMASCTHPALPNRSLAGKLTIRRFPYRNGQAYIKAALDTLSKQNFDLIQVDNRPAFVPAIRRAFPATPIILSLHSLHFLSRLSRRQGGAALAQADGVTCVVKSLTSTFKNMYPQHARKFRPMLLGVDTAQFRPRSSAYKARIRTKYRLNDSYNLLFVGRIIPRKGLHTLIEAAAILRRTNKRIAVVAVGASWPGVKRESPYMKRVRRLAKRLGVPLRFMGYVPPKRVHEMYHLGDVFVCPTQFQEGFACVNSEAMASGIPLVASARGGILEVVQHRRSGLLVKSYKSPKAFAEAIGQILTNPALAKRLAGGGRSRVVSRFGWNKAVANLKAYYRSKL